jgi:hypothetical protein
MFAYTVLIFDLDGTAIPNLPNGMPTRRMVEAVISAEPYIKLCAATGRPITNALMQTYALMNGYNTEADFDGIAVQFIRTQADITNILRS